MGFSWESPGARTPWKSFPELGSRAPQHRNSPGSCLGDLSMLRKTPGKAGNPWLGFNWENPRDGQNSRNSGLGASFQIPGKNTKLCSSQWMPGNDLDKSWALHIPNSRELNRDQIVPISRKRRSSWDGVFGMFRMLPVSPRGWEGGSNWDYGWQEPGWPQGSGARDRNVAGILREYLPER